MREQIRVFHKIRKEYLESMRKMDEDEKIVDIRVQDPRDSEKVYKDFRPGDILHFVDTEGNVLRVLLSKIKSYSDIRAALEDVGYKNAFPEADSLEDAEKRCRSLGNYQDILDDHNKEEHPVFALWFMRHMIYVAGPYTPRKAPAGSPEAEDERKQNILRAVHCGKDIMRLGYLPIVPHSLFDGWENLPGLTEGVVVMAEKAAVARCEGFFKIASSKGTDDEEVLARMLNKDIFTSLDQITHWEPVGGDL